MVNHFAPAHVIDNFEVSIEKFKMNVLDSKNVIINLWKNKKIICCFTLVC